MNRVRRSLVAAIGLAPLGAAAQQQGRPAYFELNPPQPVESPGKIEVAYFFWYGCIHCYNLEPKLETWQKTLPADVYVRRVPAVFNQRWAQDAAIFYGFEALGLTDRLNRPLFEAIHRERLRTDNGPALSAWLETQGVDAKKVQSAVESFAVQSKTRRAARLTSEFKIDGTPTLVVHGRYVVASGEGMLDTVERLVGAVRKTGK